MGEYLSDTEYQDLLNDMYEQGYMDGYRDALNEVKEKQMEEIQR